MQTVNILTRKLEVDMYKFKAKISGLSPLRHNQFLEDVNNTSTKMTDEQRIQSAYDRSYYDKELGYYIPRHALKACIVKIGARVKIGKRSAGNELKAILLFEQEKFPVGDMKGEIYKESVRIPPKTGSRVIQCWVINKNWSAEFEGLILDSTFPSSAIKQAIEYAGLYNGLMDGRPEFGRFELESFGMLT